MEERDITVEGKHLRSFFFFFSKDLRVNTPSKLYGGESFFKAENKCY